MILNLKNVVAKKTFTSSGSIQESKSRIFRTSLFWYSIPFLKIRNENIDTKLKKIKDLLHIFWPISFFIRLFSQIGNIKKARWVIYMSIEDNLLMAIRYMALKSSYMCPKLCYVIKILFWGDIWAQNCIFELKNLLILKCFYNWLVCVFFK